MYWMCATLYKENIHCYAGGPSMKLHLTLSILHCPPSRLEIGDHLLQSLLLAILSRALSLLISRMLSPSRHSPTSPTRSRRGGFLAISHLSVLSRHSYTHRPVFLSFLFMLMVATCVVCHRAWGGFSIDGAATHYLPLRSGQSPEVGMVQ
jgi:hypothetical protein